MHGFFFKPGTIVKIPKFIIDPLPQRVVDQRDISILQMYVLVAERVSRLLFSVRRS